MSSLDFCHPPRARHRWLISCLCAQWCGTCRDYRSVLETLAGERTEDALVWIDIEDQAELAGDIDVETFPTLLVQQGERVLFFGAVLPGVEPLRRLLRALDEGGARTPQVDAAVQELATRLAQQP